MNFPFIFPLPLLSNLQDRQQSKTLFLYIDKQEVCKVKKGSFKL